MKDEVGKMKGEVGRMNGRGGMESFQLGPTLLRGNARLVTLPHAREVKARRRRLTKTRLRQDAERPEGAFPRGAREQG